VTRWPARHRLDRVVVENPERESARARDFSARPTLRWRFAAWS